MSALSCPNSCLELRSRKQPLEDELHGPLDLACAGGAIVLSDLGIGDAEVEEEMTRFAAGGEARLGWFRTL